MENRNAALPSLLAACSSLSCFFSHARPSNVRWPQPVWRDFSAFSAQKHRRRGPKQGLRVLILLRLTRILHVFVRFRCSVSCHSCSRSDVLSGAVRVLRWRAVSVCVCMAGKQIDCCGDLL